MIIYALEMESKLMSYIRRPHYYKKFKCISSACTDSCCQGWEIDIDEDTLKSYKAVEGSFGKRLMDNISIPDDDSLPAHFIQTKGERCPFLNEQNLCDIFINIGQEHLSQICTHHPRYYDWFFFGKEEGLGLCCEEAARLVLLDKVTSVGEMFDVIETEGEMDVEEQVYDDDLTAAVCDVLFDIRQDIFKEALKDTKTTTTGQIISSNSTDNMNEIFSKINEYQKKYDDVIFGEVEDDETVTGSDELLPPFDEIFWSVDFIKSLLSFLRKLEINDMSWWGLLGKLYDNCENILEHKAEFEEYYKDKDYKFNNLFVYFIFRHFCKTRFDDEMTQKIIFALISVSVIKFVDIYYYIRDGKLLDRQQIEICKLYSKEIEYDEDNTASLSRYMCECE